MTVREFYLRFIAVHKCGGCRDILDHEHAEDALCEACRLRWNEVIIKSCGECFKPACECSCMPKTLSSAGALCLRKMFFYEKDGVHTPEMELLYIHKHRKIRRMTDFVAEQMLRAVREELEGLGVDDIDKRVVVTFVPRGKRSRRSHGFDQSELLARSLSRMLGCECTRVFDTRLIAREQKDLDTKRRISNARKNIYVKSEDGVEGKYVILVDDVVTTGASMSVCVKSLVKMGAVGVLCFSLASKNVKGKKDN